MSQHLLIHRDERGIARVTLNRPDVHNAFNDALIVELTEVLDTLGQDEQVRAIVLTGEGHSFCAGADLNWMRGMAKYDEAANYADALRLADLMQTLNDLPKPTIARVNGSAFGGGVGLIACCDMAVSVDDASFALTEVKLGLAPAVISPYVVAAIGERQARRWFLTAEPMSATVAKELGLLHESVVPEMLDDVVEAWLKALLRAGPYALTATKKLIERVGTNAQLRDGRLTDDTAKLISHLRVSPEGQEGLTAFLEKRKAKWVG